MCADSIKFFVQLYTKRDSHMQIAVGSLDIVTSMLTLASCDSIEVQTCSAHCLARFAAWQGATQLAICTPKNAEVRLCVCLSNLMRLPVPLTPPVSAESLESMLSQQQDNSWSFKGNFLDLPLQSHVECPIPVLKIVVSPWHTGCEQRVLGGLSEMHGKHVLCITWRMSAAQLLQQSPTGCFVPAPHSQNPGRSPMTK